MVKKIGIGVVVLLLVGAGVVVYILGNLNDLVRSAVEEAGSKVTGVSVTLGEVDIDLTGASAAMGNLNVANPAGFQSDYAFNLGGIKVTLDKSSLTGNPVVIKEVIVTAPKIIYEVGGGLSNIETIQANVDRFIKDTVGEGGGGGDTAEEGEAQKVVIEKLSILGAEVSVSAAFLGGEALGTTVPDITLTDIGKEDGGADPAEVASRVIDELLAGVTGAVGGLNLDDLAKGATEALEGITEGAAEAVGGVTEGAAEAVEGVTEGAGTAVEDAAGEAGKALENLFGD